MAVDINTQHIQELLTKCDEIDAELAVWMVHSSDRFLDIQIILWLKAEDERVLAARATPKAA